MKKIYVIRTLSTGEAVVYLVRWFGGFVSDKERIQDHNETYGENYWFYEKQEAFDIAREYNYDLELTA